MVKAILQYSTLCFFILFTSSVYAIDKKFHPYVTHKAILEFNSCLNKLDITKINLFDAEVIEKYTRREDESPLLDRALNWHFYDASRNTSNKLKDFKKFKLFNVTTSMHSIFKIRIATLKSKQKNDVFADEDEFYNNETVDHSAGRVIHYIQDVGIPAHVAPIYHANPDSWWKEHILGVKYYADTFDELFSQENIDKLKAAGINNDSCRKLYEESQSHSFSLEDLLEQLALQTRKRVAEEINVPKGHLWYKKRWQDVFWPMRTGDNQYENDKLSHVEFGKYGYLRYLKPEFKLQSAQCSGTKNVCRDFFKDQFITIRDHTVLALMMIYLRQ